jgi:hypothetical protein
MKKLLTLMILSATTVVVMAQQPPMPTPGPEHKAISAFAGKWSFEGKMNDGPMGPGGPSLTEIARCLRRFACLPSEARTRWA